MAIRLIAILPDYLQNNRKSVTTKNFTSDALFAYRIFKRLKLKEKSENSSNTGESLEIIFQRKFIRCTMQVAPQNIKVLE